MQLWVHPRFAGCGVLIGREWPQFSHLLHIPLHALPRGGVYFPTPWIYMGLCLALVSRVLKKECSAPSEPRPLSLSHPPLRSSQEYAGETKAAVWANAILDQPTVCPLLVMGEKTCQSKFTKFSRTTTNPQICEQWISGVILRHWPSRHFVTQHYCDNRLLIQMLRSATGFSWYFVSDIT